MSFDIDAVVLVSGEISVSARRFNSLREIIDDRDSLPESNVFEQFRLRKDLNADIEHSGGRITFKPVSHIWWSGEGSGYGYGDLKDFLRLSNTDFVLVVIWEGGETVTRINYDAKNGIIDEIDLYSDADTFFTPLLQ